jgi:acetyl-CoA carboxylase biotin carboxylase subunit
MYFEKVLVANRGEIALRVIRACRELGIGTVAVYSDADARAAHVQAADEAVAIGAAPSGESYLRGEQIVAAAQKVGAQAIHPGYGFLSERAWFARLVEDSGLVWIGPPADAIAAMGNKTDARRLVAAAGVPVVPGTTESVRDASEAADLAEQFGYPVLLKAAAGGGGKGMRLVHSAAELEGAFAAASREARNAFGDGALYIEKFLQRPRHIEIQVLADRHGTVISLGERECSIQRRHQKMVEEAPSVAVSAELRRRMGETAVTAARAVGYINAGTCEFLLDRTGQFYFLEMNTRIQVEHPVTELVTGLDLVKWQILIAAGQPLPPQLDVAPRGWAIECRITSEDAAAGFLPSTGTVTALRLPGGPGVRWDGGIEVGSEIGLHYDPLLGKLICWGETRQAAVTRMRRALRELRVVGVETSREFLLKVIEHPSFAAGEVDIQWLEREARALQAAPPPAEELVAAALVAAMQAAASRAAPVGGEAGRSIAGNGWLIAARTEAVRSLP